MKEQNRLFKVALAGNPNVGKSSLFNQLTGLRQKTGNFPGVTVDKKTGIIELPGQLRAEVIDLPGLYSLYPVSSDEKVVLNVLTDPNAAAYPDVIVVVADANDLERNLLLCTQIMDLQIPPVLAVNMLDTAAEKGLHVSVEALSAALGIPVVAVNGRTGAGKEDLLQCIRQQLTENVLPKSFNGLTMQEQAIVDEVAGYFKQEGRYLTLLQIHHYRDLPNLTEEQRSYISAIRNQQNFDASSAQLDEMMQRYKKLAPVLSGSLEKRSPAKADSTSKLDQVLTHPLWGILIFLALMVLVFQAIFSWSEYPMTWIESFFAEAAALFAGILPEAWYTDLLTEGIIAGLSGVLVFIPQIAVLFFLISLLEESGYMARVVYLLDHLMQRFGLNGRSVVSLISGGACAIPAIMATRTIGNWKERLVTILVTPLISCSARIPVFTILIAVTIPPLKWMGMNVQGLVFLALYAIGAIAALLSAWVFSKILKTAEPSYLLMELPQYQVPQWKNVGLTVVEKVKTFAWEAGRIIMAVSVVLWVLASYGPSNAMEEAEQKALAAYELSDEEDLEQLQSAYRLEASYAGYLGRVIEPLIAPLGYDWKIGVALITSFAAREVFVGTMATIYAVGDESNEVLLRERMEQARHPESGAKVFTIATALSLMIFYLFAMQCMSTLAVVKRETKTWKWPMIQLGYMTVLAYGASFAVYHIAVAAGLG